MLAQLFRTELTHARLRAILLELRLRADVPPSKVPHEPYPDRHR